MLLACAHEPGQSTHSFIPQAELAARVGTKQPGIARLESGRVVPKLELLQKIAVAAGRKLEVRFAALDTRKR